MHGKVAQTLLRFLYCFHYYVDTVHLFISEFRNQLIDCSEVNFDYRGFRLSFPISVVPS